MKNIIKMALVIVFCGAFLTTGQFTGRSRAEGTGEAAGQGKTREYFIAAEEVEWNFAPAGRDEVMGHKFTQEQNVFTKATASTIGSTYRMARFFAYTDKSFATRAAADDRSNGILGPVIRAEVGDTIIVHFKNKTTIPTSMHPHGVFYKKDAEGSMTNDGTSMAEMADEMVMPGQSYDYVWPVPERAGPGPRDASSVVWFYHSHVDGVRDPNTGLFGAIVVTAKGKADADGKPTDVDREEFSFFGILDQNQNIFLPKMIKNLKQKPRSGHDDDFKESNKKHTINGYLYGSQPMPQMKQGERVRWYLMSLGTETDLHTPHWHGNTVVMSGQRKDVLELLPATTLVADMVPDNPGIWMYHCHVNDHILAGMMTRYQVLPQ